MQSEIAHKIAQALTLVPNLWKQDDLGFYLPGPDESPKLGWGDVGFCFNCGEAGHTTEDCKEPEYEQIAEMFGDSLGKKGNEAKLKRAAVVKKLHTSSPG
jgi:hypothetical protein